MRHIARQSSRLAHGTRIRHSSVPRRQPERECRGFHTSITRSSEPRPPNGSSDRHTPVNEWRQQQRDNDKRDDTQGQAAEQDNEDPKLENEPRRAATRRALRARRSEVPKPPPIPKWFLKHNVRLVEDRQESDLEETKWETIRCVDTETGHTLFTVQRPTGEKKSKQMREKQALLDKLYRESARGQSEEEQVRDQLQSVVEEAEVLKREQADRKDDQLDSHAGQQVKGALDSELFQTKYNEQGVDEKGNSTPTSKEVLGDIAPQLRLALWMTWKEWYSDPLRHPFLEAEASARAAFSFADQSHPSASFATEHVDLSLQCADPDSHEQMDEFVHDLAHVLNADVIQLDANDFAELTDEYVGQGDDAPGSFSNLGYEVFDGYEASGLADRNSPFRFRNEEDEDMEDDEDEADEDEHSADVGRGLNLQRFLQNSGVGKLLSTQVVGIGIGTPVSNRGSGRWAKPSTSVSDSSRNDALLTALLDSLLNAPKEKRSAFDASKNDNEAQHSKDPSQEQPSYWLKGQRLLRANPVTWMSDTAEVLLHHSGSAFDGKDATKVPYRLLVDNPNDDHCMGSTTTALRQTIVYVRDLRDIHSSKLGENIIRRLSKTVNKRRRIGERIMIIGATAQDVPGPVIDTKDRDESFPFRVLNIPPVFNKSEPADEWTLRHRSPAFDTRNLDAGSNRILEINLRHLQSMLRRMRPDDNINLTQASARKQLNLPSTHFLGERVLSLDQVQRLALVSIGLAQSHARSDRVHPVHVALAASTTQRVDHGTEAWIDLMAKKQRPLSTAGGSSKAKGEDKSSSEQDSARLERIKKSCNQHESRLFSGVVDAHKIKSGFKDVHAPKETITALETMTSLSLLRPDAFKYGVLANDRLPGLLLYGPPGTGKTLLAKAVAKESKATVMEVSGAQIYEKYVGEGEKMVRAVFSLAKKLSPCVVFIDEADAIFGSRNNASNRTTHREIINQFLREWDGMDDHGAFMMMATNRPFDLDDAVLRRLPRRLLVDLPVAKDRESILGIHLRDEKLDSDVSLAKLAEQTPFYSGSDLKNLSVAAALSAVREENDLASSKKDDQEFKLPEVRTLMQQHFEKALAEISASISEDMGSLTAIRKFDEQYGDRRGKKKKMGMGFSIDAAVDEAAVLVRRGHNDVQPPTTPP